MRDLPGKYKKKIVVTVGKSTQAWPIFNKIMGPDLIPENDRNWNDPSQQQDGGLALTSFEYNLVIDNS